MNRIVLILIAGVAIGIGIARLMIADPKEKTSENGEHVKVLASDDVKETLDGKDATVTMVEERFE